jgi:hypothetical protein
VTGVSYRHIDRAEGSSQGQPLLSLIVIAFNIPREIARTLVSLSAGYQRDIDPGDYEIIVVDNGSGPALGEDAFAGLSGNFRLITMDPPHPSPAQLDCQSRFAGL